MKLAKSKFGISYRCAKGWNVCKGSHGAHPNGSPMGIPAKYKIRKLRTEAHETFDRLWKKDSRGNSIMSRSEAYAWMRKALELDKAEGHISRFDANQCRKLMQKFQEDFPDLSLSLDPI